MGADEACNKLPRLLASEAMLGHEIISAEPTEPTEVFHRRLQRMAKERGIRVIELGSPSNNVPLKEAPPYFPGGARPADVAIN